MTDTATETEAGVLAHAVEAFWGAMLGLDIERVRAYETAARETAATVSIMGDVAMSLVVRMPDGLARHITAAMFAMEPDEVGDDEIGDAVGEIANVVAGALKGTLDADCRLSLPSVSEGGALRLGVPGGAVRTEVCFVSNAHPFAVQVWVRAE